MISIDNVVVATHVFTPGTSQALRKYLLNKNKKVLFIQHSVFGNVFTWGLGMMDTFWKVIKSGKKYDLYVGNANWPLTKSERMRTQIFKTIPYNETNVTSAGKTPNNDYIYYDENSPGRMNVKFLGLNFRA